MKQNIKEIRVAIRLSRNFNAVEVSETIAIEEYDTMQEVEEAKIEARKRCRAQALDELSMVDYMNKK